MCTLLTRAWRIKLFHWLPGYYFDEVLDEAKKYHEAHPPEEILVMRDPDLATIDESNEEVIKATVRKHHRDHREGVMMPFLRKNVPYNLAREAVDGLILAKNEPAG